MTIEAKGKALESKQAQRAWLAWHIAALQRAKRLPKLKDLLPGAAAPARATDWQAQKAIAMALNAASGGTVIEKGA